MKQKDSITLYGGDSQAQMSWSGKTKHVINDTWTPSRTQRKKHLKHLMIEPSTPVPPEHGPITP